MSNRRTRFLAVLLIVGLAVAAAGCGQYFEEDRSALPNRFKLPAGTQVRVTIDRARPPTFKVGESFAGILAESLYFRPEAIDTEGRTFERDEYLVAAQGSPVYGTVVEIKGPEGGEARVAVKLTSIKFLGDRSFTVQTTPVPIAGEPPDGLLFELAEPVDVALIVEQHYRGRAPG